MWNIPLQRRAKTAGVVDTVVATIAIISAGIDIRLLLDAVKTEADDNKLLAANNGLFTLYATCALSMVKCIMGIILWKGAEARDVKRCQQWMYVSGILWIIQVINYITNLLIGTVILVSIIFTGFSILIRVFVIFVVHLFINEIQTVKYLEPDE